MMATSYDYDAPLNEYGFPHDPKNGLLVGLHKVLNKFEDVIMDTDTILSIPTHVSRTVKMTEWEVTISLTC